MAPAFLGSWARRGIPIVLSISFIALTTRTSLVAILPMLLTGVWISFESAWLDSPMPEVSWKPGSLFYVQILPPAAFLFGAIVPSPRVFSSAGVASMVGCVIVLLVIVVRIWSIRCLGRNFTYNLSHPTTICCEGPFAIIRHPAYASLFPMLAGFVLGLNSWAAIVVLEIANTVLFVVARIEEEEKMMLEDATMGAAYRKYCELVKYRLVPGIF